MKYAQNPSFNPDSNWSLDTYLHSLEFTPFETRMFLGKAGQQASPNPKIVQWLNGKFGWTDDGRWKISTVRNLIIYFWYPADVQEFIDYWEPQLQNISSPEFQLDFGDDAE